MKALTLHGREDLRFERVDDPTIEQPGDAIVEVELAAICGSDLHPYFDRETGYDPGTVQGHEFVGRIVALGAGVSTLELGDLVHCPFTTSCGECRFCLEGLTSRCLSGQLFGWRQEEQGLHGGQAELVRVPLAASTLVRIPEGVSQVGALLLGDVLSTGYYCAKRSGVRSGSIVGVIGCGPVGLMAVVAARELGAERVFAFDPVSTRREFAQRFGAEAREPEELGEVMEELSGIGVDAALEAVGSPASARLAFDLVRPGGVLSAVGVHTSTTFPFSPVEAYDRNLTLQLGRCPARALMEDLAPVVASRRYDLDSIVTDRLPLAEGPDAYRRFAERDAGCLKVCLEPKS